MLLSALLLVAAVIYVMSPDERSRLVRRAIAFLHEAKESATHVNRADDQFHTALRARQPRAVVTVCLVALNTAIFIVALFSTGRLGDAQTLIGLGGNVGPRTTNGEWWRLVMSTFIHGGLFHLLINMAALLQIGLIVERVTGWFLFAAVYVVAGIFASLAAVSAYPIDVSIGASASICGLIGLGAAATGWLSRQPSELQIPWIVIKRLFPITAVFLVWNLFTGDMPLRGELTGLVVGLVSGVVLTMQVHEAIPPGRRVAGAVAFAAGLAVAFAIPIRGIADVRPEIGSLAALEERTASAYEIAVERFKTGRLSNDALVQMIARAIVPELQAADAHLKSVRHVPAIHEPLVADAGEYLRLRTQSWQLRAEGLRSMNRAPERESAYADPVASARGRERATARHRATTTTMARAEAAERASLAALQRIRQDKTVPTKDQ